MTRPNRPEDTAARMAAIESRLKALEVGGRAEHTTMQGGLFRIRDIAGDLRAAMGDLDGDNTTWGYEVTQGGVFRVRDADGVLRGALGDIDDDDNFYALVLYQSGVVQVRDETDTPQATLGYLGDDPDSTLPMYGVDVFNAGLIRVFGGGQVQVLDGGSIQVIGEGRAMLIDGASLSASESGSGPWPVWLGDLELRLGPEYAGKYGLVVGPNDASVHFWVDEDGMHDPPLAIPCVDWTLLKPTSSAGFESLWAARPFRISHGGLMVSVNYNADPGTTGEVRVSGPSASTDAVTIGDGASGTAMFQWLHGEDLGSGPIVFDVEARVTSGAGEVHLAVPDAALCDPGICTETGL